MASYYVMAKMKIYLGSKKPKYEVFAIAISLAQAKRILKNLDNPANRKNYMFKIKKV